MNFSQLPQSQGSYEKIGPAGLPSLQQPLDNRCKSLETARPHAALFSETSALLEKQTSRKDLTTGNQ